MSRYEAQWLAQVTGGQWTCLPDRPIRSVMNDTRRLDTGALYVALRGDNFDGHAFVENAFKAGAAAAMVNRDGIDSADRRFSLLAVDDTRDALLALGAAHRQRVAPLVIGVTGSVGKSTVKEMTAAVLGAAGETARTLGNWNNEIGLPLSLLAMEPNTRFGVFEAGMNHPGELFRLANVLRSDWGVVTTVGPVHLEFFDSEEAIAREKGELLRALPPGGKAFLNRDDVWYPLLREMAPCEVKTVSLEGDADLIVRGDEAAGRLFVSGLDGDQTHEFEWTWAGRHNALNAGFALLIGREAGMTWRQMALGLATYRPLPMRWQELRVEGCLFINDAYNANPASMRAALATFATTRCEGRRWLLLGDMFELGVTAGEEHENLGGELADRGGWAGLLTVGPLAARIADGARRKGLARECIWKCDDTRTAAAVLKAQLAPGDAVLLKASRGVALEKVIEELRLEYEKEES